MKNFSDFLRDERGASAVEYGMTAAFIAMAMSVALPAVGTSVTSSLTSFQNGMNDRGPCSARFGVGQPSYLPELTP